MGGTSGWVGPTSRRSCWLGDRRDAGPTRQIDWHGPVGPARGVSMALTVIRLPDLPADRLTDLVAEAEGEDHCFLRRLVEEWESGVNRFAQPGEALFAAVADGRVVGVCGLNRDPYTADERVGRVRHLYVQAAYRRRGVGRRLIAAVVAAAQGVFGRLRLRTNSATAARFYEALGFRPCGEAACTHTLVLAGPTGAAAQEPPRR